MTHKTLIGDFFIGVDKRRLIIGFPMGPDGILKRQSKSTIYNLHAMAEQIYAESLGYVKNDSPGGLFP